MGRNGQPINLLLVKGKKHLTKSEITHRKESQIKIGDQRLKCPQFVKDDATAYEKWREIVKLYKDIDFVSSGDTGHLARYCETFSEYQDLVNRRRKIAAMDDFDLDESEIILEQFENEYGKIRAGKLFEKVEYILSTGGIMAMDKAINGKMTSLVQMEDRLFLNPLAKTKNIPKKEVKKEDPLASKGFGNV